MKLATNVRRVLMVALVVTSTATVAVAHDGKHQCSTITRCRHAITWNHSVVASVNARLAIADNRTPGGRAAPVCHQLVSCRLVLRQQVHARVWAEGAWQHFTHDNTVAGAERIVRYRFTTCGGPIRAQQAHSIVGWESGWKRYNINGAGDTSWWQIERPAHPEVSLAAAEDAWTSTGIAVRWSHCGENWDPAWSSVRDHGMNWA